MNYDYELARSVGLTILTAGDYNIEMLVEKAGRNQ